MVFFFSKPNLKWIKFDFNTTSQVFLFALIKNAAIYNFNTEVWTSFFPSKFVFRKRYIHLHRFDFRRSFTKKKTSTMICIAKNINSFPLAEKWKYDVRCVFVSPKDYYLKLKYSTSRVFFHSSVLSFEGKWKKNVWNKTVNCIWWSLIRCTIIQLGFTHWNKQTSSSKTKQKTNKIKLFSYQEAIAPTQSTIDQNSNQKLKARKKISQT